MVISVLAEVWSYIVVDNWNLLRNPCTIAHHISLSKNTVCSLTIVRWGGMKERRQESIQKREDMRAGVYGCEKLNITM